MAGTITHKWNGTTLIVTSDSGTSACDLKGEKGDMGVRGCQGKPGILTDTSGTVLAPADSYYMKEEVDDIAEALNNDLGKAIAELDSTASNHNKRLINLEHRLDNAVFTTDDSIAYAKQVPEDAAPYAEVAKIGGMSYKSANLLDMDNCVVTQNTTKEVGEGSLTVTGYIVQNTITHLVAGKKYTFSAKSTRTGERGGGISIECYDSGSAIVYSNYRQDILNPNVTFTVPQNAVRTRFYFYGGTQGSTSSATYTKVMLNEGSTAPYSPYFEGIHHAKVTAVKGVSANLIPFPYYDGSRLEHNGITFTVNADGSIHVKGTATAEARFYLTRGIRWAYENVYASGSSVTADGKTFKGVAYANSGTYPLYVRVSVAESANGIDKTLYPRINYGDTALDFTPYAEYEPLPIPEAVQALDCYGLGVDATAYNYIDWKEKKYYKNVGQYVFKGTEGWNISPQQQLEGYTRFDVYISKTGIGAKSSSGVLCNKYDYNGANKPGVWCNNDTPNALEFRIMTNKFSTAEELKEQIAQWYADGNPLVVVYALAVPEVIDISNILSDDNFIQVECNGATTPVNEHSHAAPSEIVYQHLGGTQ